MVKMEDKVINLKRKIDSLLKEEKEMSVCLNALLSSLGSMIRFNLPEKEGIETLGAVFTETLKGIQEAYKKDGTHRHLSLPIKDVIKDLMND